jgi:hypothetical protein
MTAPSLVKLETLKANPMEGEGCWAALREILSKDKVLRTKLAEINKDLPRLQPLLGPVQGFAAEGYLGQYLVVMPRNRIVAVRQRRARAGAAWEGPKRDFGNFAEMVAELSPLPGRARSATSATSRKWLPNFRPRRRNKSGQLTTPYVSITAPDSNGRAPTKLRSTWLINPENCGRPLPSRTG